MLEELKSILEEQGRAWSGYAAKSDERFKAIEQELLGLKRGRALGGYPASRSDADPGSEAKLVEGLRLWVTGDQVKAEQLWREAKAMSADSGPDGGYVVHSVISSTMTTVMEEQSPVYRLARKITLDTGDAFEEPVDRDAAGASWVGERQDRDDTTTPQLKLLSIPLNEIYAQPKVTQKLLDVSSLNLASWLSGKVGDAFAVAESAAFHTGDGIIKPRGFLTYTVSSSGDATRTWGEIQYIGTGAAGAFPTSSTTVNPADVLVDVVSAMKAQYRSGAVWLMNRATAGKVRKLKDADGRHVWVDSLVQGQPAVLLGYPVEIDEDLPDVSSGSLSIAFANLEKAYTIVERPGVRFLADPYTAKPYVRLYNYRRVGGGVNNFEAIKLLKFS